MEKSKALEAPLNFDSYTFRSSSAGKLMGKPKGGTPFQIYNKALIEHDEYKVIVDNGGKLTKPQQKKYDELKAKLPELEKRKNDVVLSETAISYLIEVYSSFRYKIVKEIGGKYLDSGKAREEESIRLISAVDDELYEKCVLPRMRNSHVEGECDILYPLHAPEIVIDAKSCWDAYTFEPHSLDTDIENDIYEWQGICYSELYGISKFKLCYTLVDMPDEIVKDELKRILYKFGTEKEGSAEYQEACDEFIAKSKYSHLPDNERVISFSFEYNEEKRKEYLRLCRYIEAARKWLNRYAIMRWEQTNKKKWDGERYENESQQETKMVDIVEVPVVISEPVKKKCPQCDSTDLIFREGGEEDFECNDCGYDNIIDGQKGKEVISQVLEMPVIKEKVVVTNITETKDGIVIDAISIKPDEDKIEKIEKEIFEQIKKCKSIDKLEAYLKHLIDNNIISETPEYMSIYNGFSNKDKEIKSVPRKWYYVAETDSFHLYSSEEYNALDENSTFFNLLGFICDAVSYHVDEAKKVIDNSKNITVTSSFTEPQPIVSQQVLPVVDVKDAQPEPLKPVQSEEITDQILKEIDALDSKDACLDYYTEKGSDYWLENPAYYRALDAKKKSFITSKPVQPEPAPKPQSPKQPPVEDTAKSVKQTLTSPILDEPQEGDDVLIEGFKKLYPTFTTVDEFRILYVSNRAVIDRNKKFRKELDLAGQVKAKEILEETRKKIEEDMKNS